MIIPKEVLFFYLMMAAKKYKAAGSRPSSDYYDELIDLANEGIALYAGEEYLIENFVNERDGLKSLRSLNRMLEREVPPRTWSLLDKSDAKSSFAKIALVTRKADYPLPSRAAEVDSSDDEIDFLAAPSVADSSVAAGQRKSLVAQKIASPESSESDEDSFRITRV